MTGASSLPMGKLADDASTPRMILHIGAPKCGSSSLQKALSSRPDFKNAYGTPLSYVCVSSRSSRTGNTIRIAAAASPYGYVSSSDVRDTDEAEVLGRRIEAATKPIMASGSVPILSCEGWARRAVPFQKSGVFERLGGGVHVVLFVRPPLDWLNAAWWQWGVWSGADLDLNLQRAIPNVRWPKLAQQWADTPGIDAVHVRLADCDVVQTFFDLIEAERPVTRDTNASLPPALQAFLLRNRDLRPGAHDAGIEFLLSRALADAPPAPKTDPLWVLTPKKAAEMWEDVKFHPRRLAPLLPPADRFRLAQQPKWYSAAPYGDRHATDLDDFADPKSLRDLLGWLESVTGTPASSLPSSDLRQADDAIRVQVMKLLKGPMRTMTAIKNRISG